MSKNSSLCVGPKPTPDAVCVNNVWTHEATSLNPICPPNPPSCHFGNTSEGHSLGTYPPRCNIHTKEWTCPLASPYGFNFSKKK